MTLHVYQDSDCMSWVIAESEEDALQVWCEHTGEKLSDYPQLTFTQVRDDRFLKVEGDDCWRSVEEHSAGVWAALNGRGFLASTEY